MMIPARQVSHNLTNEDIRTPVLHLMVQTVYAIALKRSDLPYGAYELNAGLVRAIDVADAERIFGRHARTPRHIRRAVNADDAQTGPLVGNCPLRTLKKTPPTWREDRVGAYCREP